MSINKVIDDFRHLLEANYPPFTKHIISNKVIDDCIDIVVSRYILDNLFNKDNIDLEDIDFLINTVGTDTCVESNDLGDLISKMSYESRESSRGAVNLNKVFVPFKIYDDILEKAQLDKNTLFTVIGVKAIKSDKIPEHNLVIGICQPKFKRIDSKFLVSLGRIRS